MYLTQRYVNAYFSALGHLSELKSCQDIGKLLLAEHKQRLPFVRVPVITEIELLYSCFVQLNFCK